MRQAQFTVRSTTLGFGIVVVLTIIMPIADLADFVGSSFTKREVAAAWTRVRPVPFGLDVREPASRGNEMLNGIFETRDHFFAQTIVHFSLSTWKCLVDDRLQPIKAH
jgi:hypothetical protein